MAGEEGDDEEDDEEDEERDPEASCALFCLLTTSIHPSSLNSFPLGST